LPKYGFPVHSVQLEILADTPEAGRLELSRDLRLAIGEYAPGSQVVAAGKVWTGFGLKRAPRKEWPHHDYVSCRCGWLQLLEPGESPASTCEHCGADVTGKRTFVVPEFGFVTS